MKKIKLELMSMSELDEFVRNEHNDDLLREGAARELIKRENSLFHPRYSPAPRVQMSAYGF